MAKTLARSSSAPPLTAQLTASTLVVAALTILFLFAFGLWASARVDDNSIRRQETFVSKWVTEQLKVVPEEQRVITIWDDAVVKARERDQLWLEENVGVWNFDFFGHDRAYVVAANGETIYAMEHGATVSPRPLAEAAPVALPFVELARSEMAILNAGLEDSAAEIAEIAIVDFVQLPEGVAVASVVPIVTSSDRLTQRAGTEFLHIAFQLVDRVLLARLADRYDLSGVEIANDHRAEEDPAGVPILSSAGVELAHIEWMPYRPGADLANEFGPVLGIACVLGIGGVLVLLFRLRRSSTELHASEAQAQFLAFHDSLTGLPNRALFEDRLERAVVAHRRTSALVALHYVDLDRFKNINDSLGHGAGDELVRQVARRLQSVVREADTVARIGGDEFAIIQADLSGDQDAEVMAKRVVELLREEFDLGGEPAHVSASVGIVLSYGPSTSSPEMMRKADIALYEAKNKGRSRFIMFAGDMDDIVRRRRQIEGDLRSALERGTELSVAYQPLFAVDGRSILGAEALVRWTHPVHGNLPPDLFISIAEERGLIEPLGEFVLRQACMTAMGADIPWVAVNVSPIQFRNVRFAQKVFSILADTGLPAHRLQLEITEGALLDQGGQVQSTLSELRAAGIKVALDDFGTGYSSMNYLRRYGVDKLKIDRSFVHQLGLSSDADAIVRAMVTLARSMHIHVTAEGVETHEQFSQLAAIGCNEFQGFLLSKPITASELRTRIRALPENEGQPALPRSAQG
jgi:diguanylate cyclase (GGDEF)-like protein